MYVGVAVLVSFFTSHYLFRWRTAMVEWYHSVYDKARKIEGAAQRVQEDTIKFSRIMESLGTSLIEALMILIEFMPILFGLSIGNTNFFLWGLGLWFNCWCFNLVCRWNNFFNLSWANFKISWC